MITLLVSATLAAAAPVTPAASMPTAEMVHSKMAGMDHSTMAEAKPDCCKKGCCADKGDKAATKPHQN